MIFISTGGRKDISAYRYALELIEYGFDRIELSAGAYDGNEFELIKSLSNSNHLLLHNYYPPHPTPFVLNLASMNDTLAAKSMAHVRKALDWSAAFGGKYYGIHAGYLIDPSASELGRSILNRKTNDRQLAFNLFLSRVEDLSKYAKNIGIELLIENNVVNSANYNRFGRDPFLMTTADECVFAMEHLPSNVGLLIDVAHAKVSAQTLGFSAVDFLDKCAPWTRGYHISDNDGNYDTNSIVERESWFWPHIRKDLDYYTLEVYEDSEQTLWEQYNLCQVMIANGPTQ